MRITCFATCLLSVLGCLVSVAAAGDLRTVVISGNVAPGTSVIFLQFGGDGPVLNDAGQTAFLGRLSGIGVNLFNENGIWSEGKSAGLALVARVGNIAPGTNSEATFVGLDNPILNDVGQIAFHGFVSDNNSSIWKNGIWSEGGGIRLAPIALEGEPVPGVGNGINFTNYIDLRGFNNVGQTVFNASASDVNDGIWSEQESAGPTLIAYDGNIAPGTNNGVTFIDLRFPALNDAGQTVFAGKITGTGVNDSNEEGIWSEGAGAGLALVAREGDEAPGTENAYFHSDSFNGFRYPTLNAAGQTAFSSSLTGPGINNSNNMGIWSEGRGGTLALVIRKGDAAPGTSNGIVFSDLGSLVLNDAGQTAFLGGLTGTGVTSSNNSGIWSEGIEGILALVARKGDAAPDSSGDAYFSSFFGTVLNGIGQTAFIGRLAGTNIDASNERGIWAEDSLGVLRLIARQGDLLDIDDGPGIDFRTIKTLSFAGNTGNGDGRRSGFNNFGQLAFRATFTDGSEGIFVSSLVAIPEPSTLFLAALSAVGILLNRRR